MLEETFCHATIAIMTKLFELIRNARCLQVHSIKISFAYFCPILCETQVLISLQIQKGEKKKRQNHFIASKNLLGLVKASYNFWCSWAH